jgi:ATP:ADP antiporter, AAA family
MASVGVLDKLAAALGIKRGEFMKALCFFFYLLLIIASYVISKTVRDSLFLSKFGAVKLPYMYIGIAILVSLFVAVYLRIARRVQQHILLSLTLLFFISNVVFFWWLFRFQLDWLYPVIYIWAGIFGVIAPMQVWTLASSILTTRQAKRLYGFIGSGGLLGAIAGGFFSSWMVSIIGTENLLLSLAGFLAVCVLLVNLIGIASRRDSTSPKPEHALERKETPSNLWQSVSLITQSRYLLLIAGIISIGSIATTIVDYQFKAVANESLNSKDQLTAFFGDFYGYLGIAAFLLQILLTSKMMQRLGIGFTIFLLPIGLVLGSAALLSFMTLWAAVLLKGPDQLFKHSVDKSTVELLYLPIPAGVKTTVKPFIDTVIWRLADGVAGVILLFLISLVALNLWQITLVNVALLCVWLAIAYVVRRGYINALRLAVYRQDLDPEKLQVSIQDPSTIAGLIKSLDGADTPEILYVLEFLDLVQDKKKLAPHLENLLDHEAPEVRAKVLGLLLEVDEDGLVDKVKPMIEDEAIEVQVAAIQFLAVHSGQDPLEMTQALLDDTDYKIKGATCCFLVINRGETDYYVFAREMLEALLHSEDVRARCEAARVLGAIRGPSDLYDGLLRLLQDLKLRSRRSSAPGRFKSANSSPSSFLA